MKLAYIILIISATALLSYSFTINAGSKEKNNLTKTVVVGTNIGDKAPNIVGESPDGKKISISSLKGKYVLIDFWASWCGPCRRENPNVVAARRKYKGAKFKKGKGFEVFSVSLDNNIDKWKTAIKKDGLDWKYHVSDLKGWSSEFAKAYGVVSIPHTILIGPDGKIIAKNLRGDALDRELDNYVKSL